MTIIVYDPASDKVFVDSSHSWTDGATHVGTKVLRVSDRFTAAYAGDYFSEVVLEMAVEMLTVKQAAQYKLLDEQLEHIADGAEAIIRDTVDRKVYYAVVSKRALSVVRAGNVPLAIGSGASFFRAYMSDKLNTRGEEITALAAVEKVCASVATCGLPIETF